MSVNVFKIVFFNDNKLYEIYARSICQSDLFGFIEIEDVLFGEQSSVLVDPAEEKLKNEFGNVVRSYIPMNNIVRIDEVKKQEVAKIKDLQNNITQFPSVNFTNRPSISKPKDRD